MGNPSVASASARNDSAFFATRSALVPTARTAERGKPRRRSAKPRERLERAGLGDLIDATVAGEAGAQADGVPQAVQKVDLIVDDPTDLQVENCWIRSSAARVSCFTISVPISYSSKRRYHNAVTA